MGAHDKFNDTCFVEIISHLLLMRTEEEKNDPCVVSSFTSPFSNQSSYYE